MIKHCCNSSTLFCENANETPWFANTDRMSAQEKDSVEDERKKNCSLVVLNVFRQIWIHRRSTDAIVNLLAFGAVDDYYVAGFSSHLTSAIFFSFDVKIKWMCARTLRALATSDRTREREHIGRVFVRDEYRIDRKKMCEQDYDVVANEKCLRWENIN